jgi:hypothetical protein
MEVTLTELEDAINYWRTHRPSSGEECSLSPEVNALATSYALMIFHGLKSVPAEQVDSACLELIRIWRDTR